MANNDQLLVQLIENDAGEDVILEVLNQITERKSLVNFNERQEKDLDDAYEKTPEFFVPIDMLYVPLKINNHDINAYVDTGAGLTIINRETAERCGLIERINQKFSTKIVGVGSSETLGKIFNLELQLGGFIIEIVVSVVETGPDFLLGLDTLKNHKLIIDLAKNCLKNDYFSIPFINFNRPLNFKEM